MKVSLDVIRFSFIEPLHVSNPRSDYARSEETVRSDTLSAAIMQSWALMGREQWINDDPGFVTSSLFPFRNLGEETIYMFPKPVKDHVKNNLTYPRLKKFKKVKYYDQEYFEQRLRGPLIIDENDIKNEMLSKRLMPGQENFCKTTVVPRIMRPRDPREDTRIFYMERKSFYPETGLFCIVSYKSPGGKERFLTGLRLLADNGLGSDRSVGHGRFSFVEDVISLDLPDNCDALIGLSLYLPSSHQELVNSVGPLSRYEITRRGGWISEPFNTLRKRNVYMFCEGSLFMSEMSALTVMGKVADVKPTEVPTHHAIYRSGECIFLPIKIS